VDAGSFLAAGRLFGASISPRWSTEFCFCRRRANLPQRKARSTGMLDWLRHAGDYLTPFSAGILPIVLALAGLYKFLSDRASRRQQTERSTTDAGVSPARFDAQTALLTAARILYASMYGPILGLYYYFSNMIFLVCLVNGGLVGSLIALSLRQDMAAGVGWGFLSGTFLWICASAAYFSIKQAEADKSRSELRNLVAGVAAGSLIGSGIAALLSRGTGLLTLGLLGGAASGLAVSFLYDNVSQATPIRERDKILTDSELVAVAAQARRLRRDQAISCSAFFGSLVLSQIVDLGELGPSLVGVSAIFAGYSLFWARLAIPDAERSRLLSTRLHALDVIVDDDRWRGDGVQVIDSRRFGRARSVLIEEMFAPQDHETRRLRANRLLLAAAARKNQMIFLCRTQGGRWFAVSASDLSRGSDIALAPLNEMAARHWLSAKPSVLEKYFPLTAVE
jgi:hypothetical protein